jgi:glycosyltransferase involved in cell wall biosynthesis
MADKSIKKILILSHEFPPLGGGGGRILSFLCGELHRRGYEATVLTAAPPAASRKSFPFPVVYFPTVRRAQFQTSVPAMLLFIAQAVLYCLTRKARGFDMLLSNMSIPAGIAGIIARRLLKVPHVIWYHNTEVTQNRASGAGLLFRWAHLFIARRADANLFISRSLMECALSYGPIPRPQVLPNAPQIKAEAPLPCPAGDRLFLFAGRMEKVKNPVLLVHAMQELKNSGRAGGIRLLMVGGGNIFDRVEHEIARCGLQGLITLEPAAPFERMAELYRSTYALVLPSVVEGFPTTILEAGAFGVPTIASNTIGNRDAIVPNETGLLVPLGDAPALAGAMFRLSQDSAQRNRLGRGAFNRSREFTIERTAEAFVRTLNLLSGSSSTVASS